ncbi:MAG: hypothetical protein MN733_02855 [Nitrososphaera sp.]|nr:hypothetical protein [Nitrososphaera sp.]
MTDMAWAPLTFGKHKGRTLPQVIFSDPDWFFWAMDTRIFDNKGAAIRTEATDLNHKARNIKIPSQDGTDLVAEYLIHRPTGKFGCMQIVPTDQPLHQGSSPAFRKPTIDLSVPRDIARYDKLGCKNLLHSVKYHLFGSEHTKVTKAKAEAFFSDPHNFVC